MSTDEQVARAESLLWHWRQEWAAVAEAVAVEWDASPLDPRDQENFLCLYQERRKRQLTSAKLTPCRPFAHVHLALLVEATVPAALPGSRAPLLRDERFRHTGG